MKTTKRLLSFVLVLVMLFGMFPVQANAATIEAEHDHSETTADVQPQAADVVKVEKFKGNTVAETTYFSSLEAAFKKHFDYTNNTQMGGKYLVTLLADCDRAEISAKTSGFLAEPFDITLDLAGHTIKSSDSS